MAGISDSGRQELAAIIRPGTRLVSVDDVALALNIDHVAATQRLARWTRHRWLRRVRRGLYIPVPMHVQNPETWVEDSLVLADAVWSPCYFTGWTSASHWGLTDQVFRTTVLRTANRIRQNSQTLLNHDFLVYHTSRATSGPGIARVWRLDTPLGMADPALTIAELLDNPGVVGGIRHGSEIVAEYFRRAASATAVIEHGDRIGNRALFKRFGYVLESLGVHDRHALAACRARLSSGFPLLDPSGPPQGERDRHWGLRVNVSVSPGDAT